MKSSLWMRLFFCTLWLLLVGCASMTSPDEEPGRTTSESLLKDQLKVAQQQLTQSRPAGRIIFAGFATNASTHAFRGDVVLTEKWIKTIDPNAIVFKLNNPAQGQSIDWPYATAQNLSQVFAWISLVAKPQDKVVILISTHGRNSVLSINFGDKHYPYIDPKWLHQQLNTLQKTPVLLLISACYSGSFIEPLATSNRIILTASAKDRASFGCQFSSRNTFFIDALFKQLSDTNLSLVNLMEKAKSRIDILEAVHKLKSSMPQSYVGTSVQDWANQSMENWVKAP